MAQPTTGVLFSGSFPPATPGNQLCEPQTNGGTPAQYVSFQPQLATTALNGVVKPDGTTITVDSDGTIHAPSVGGGGTGAGGTSASGGFLVDVVPAGAKDGSNTQFTLPAPVLAGSGYFYVRNGVMQRQLGTKAEFGVQGTVLTTLTPLASDDWHEFYYVMGTPNSESGGGGGVTPVGSPVIRGSSMAYNDSATSITGSLPSGSQAGDFCLFLCNTSWTPQSTLSGWTIDLDAVPGTNNLLVGHKILTSGDISAGSITIDQYNPPPPTFPGTGPLALAIVTFIGAAGGIREVEYNATVVAGPPQTITNTTSSSVINTDMAIYLISQRNSSAALCTLTPASGSASTLQTGGVGQSMAVLLADQAMPGGALVVVGTVPSPGGGGGAVSVQVIVKGS